MAVTIEKLWDLYHGGGEEDFARDLWKLFGVEGGIGAEEFSREFGMYIPAYQETPEHLAFQEKHTSLKHAAATQNLAKKATENLYSTGMEKVSGSLEDELEKARSVAGGLGLRTGTLSSAVETSIESASNQAENLGDVFGLAKEGDLNAYNVKVSDAALDYEQDIYQNKKDFYDSVMAAITRITPLGAFDQADQCEGDGDCGGCQECNTSDSAFNYCFDPVGCVGGLVDNDLDGIGDSLVPGGGDDDGFEINICNISPECCTDGVKDCDLCPEACPDLIDPNDPCPGGCDHLDCNEKFSPMCGPYGCYCMKTPFN
tara:strand:- start:2174 stop:3118 length:945 start_codon:yes stop_codon:yes gene_type:complete